MRSRRHHPLHLRALPLARRTLHILNPPVPPTPLTAHPQPPISLRPNKSPPRTPLSSLETRAMPSMLARVDHKLPMLSPLLVDGEL